MTGIIGQLNSNHEVVSVLNLPQCHHPLVPVNQWRFKSTQTQSPNTISSFFMSC